MEKYKTMGELVQERIDEKPWYKKIMVLSERIVLALSAFTMVFALVSIALSVGMNMGKIAEDAGILKQIRTWGPGIPALIILYNMLYKIKIYMSIRKEQIEARNENYGKEEKKIEK